MSADSAEQFIEAWGAMGTLWGINASMARVHALLMMSDKPLGLDEIASQLQISKGNASMCLKDLRNWGVVQRSGKPGDRKDYYSTEKDIWKMFFCIARERKRREFDPAIDSVNEALRSLAPDVQGEVRQRLEQMGEFLETLDKLTVRFLEDADKAKAALQFLSGASFGADQK